MVVEIANASSRMKVISSLGASGFGGALIDVSSHDGICLILVELDGPVALDDPRFGELALQLGTPIERVYHLGGYADPVLMPGAVNPA
jgi:hypothetical protein